MSQYYIGVDIGGTKIALVKGDEEGRILEKIRFDNNGSSEEMIERILRSAASFGAVSGVGISCGGPLDLKRGAITSPPNLPGWDDVPIVTLLSEATGAPAYLQNDANACALAEWRFGAGKGTRNMIFLTFGTGLGAGLILNGALYEGTNANAGEAGHIPLASDGPVGYGKRGSFEGFCSGGGIRQQAISYAEQQLRTGRSVSYCATAEDLPSVTARSVAECAFAGCSDAKEIYRRCGEKLGLGLSILIDLFNPEAIVIGSIYARARALLEPAALQVLKEQALPQALEVCRILPAALGENLGDLAALSVAMQGGK